jgi:hypothetical protein
MMADDNDLIDSRIATIEAELGLELKGTGNEAIDAEIDAELSQEAAIPAREAAPPAADSPRAESAAGTSIKEYLDERDRRIDLERRVRDAETQLMQRQQQQAPAYGPDPFMDPAGFANARINEQLAPIRAHLAQQAMRGQIADATAAHGRDLLQKAADAFDAAAPTMHPIEAASVMESLNPFKAAVDWMRRRDMQREVGTDPNAYRERVVADALRRDPAFMRRAQEALRRVGRGGSNHGMDGESDEALIEKAIRSKSNPWA